MAERRGSSLAALCGLLGLLWGSIAVAAPAVVLLRVDDGEAQHRWRAAEARTRDELRLMGLEVEEVEVADPMRDEAALGRLLAERGATAAVRVERDVEGGEARVWLLEPQGSLRGVWLTGLSLDGGEAATLAALRTVEVVHAGLLVDDRPARVIAAAAPPAVTPVTAASVETSLLPLPPAPAPAPRVVPRVDLPQPTRPRRGPMVRVARRAAIAGRHVLAVQATVGGGPGGLGVLPGLALSYRRELPRFVGVQADVIGVMTPGWRTQTGASILMGLAGARALLVVQARTDRRVIPRLALGGGGALVWVLGRAPRPLRGVPDVGLVPLLSASAAVAVRVRPRLRVVLGGGVDVLLRSTTVRVAGSERATLGPVMLHGSLGLEWLWSVQPRR